MASTSIFVSAVTSEFEPERRLIARRLRWDGWSPVYHDELRHGRHSLLADLEAEITHCHAAIFLAGTRSGGGFPKSGETTAHAHLLPRGQTRASYTQWEYLLADQNKRRGLLYLATDAWRPAEPRPPAHDRDDPELQAGFLLWLRETGKFRTQVDDLPSLIADMRRELGHAPPVPDQRIHNLSPSLGDRFIGRDSLIDDLQRDLRAGHRAVITAAISGMSGVGKTRAAMEYARARRWDYPTALMLIQSGSVEALEANFADLVTPLGLTGLDQAPPEERTRAVIRFLADHPGWLLILDNVDEPAAMHAAHALAGRLDGGHILITSRMGVVPQGFTGLRLDVLSPEAAAAFLLASTPGRAPAADDAGQARALGDDLGHLALALTHAAAYITRLGLGFAAYRAELATAFRRVMDHVGAEVSDYQRSTLATLDLSLARMSPAALALLERLAFLADEPVPRFLLEVAVPGAEAEALREAEADLADYSLLTRNMQAGTFTTHRLVRDLVRGRLSPEAAHARLQQALGWVNAAFDGDPQDVRTWPRLLPLAEHGEHVALAAERAGIDAPTGRLMGELGVLFDARAQYGRAERMSRAALALGERRLGPDHPDVAIDLNNLGELLRATNRLSEAEPLFRRALAITEVSLGPDHPTVATGLNNLAALLSDANRLSEAEPLYRRALAITEASLGPDHPDVAIRLINLAGLLEATNRLSEAEPLYRRALAIDEASYGPGHPEVATDLDNLAGLLSDTNRLSEAEPLYRRALAITEASLGPDHPTVATRLNNLAGLVYATNRLSEAEPLYRRALAITEVSLGPDHPTVAAGLNNLASLLRATNRLSAAEPLFRRALAIDEASYGPDHPEVATGLNNLALLLYATNRLPEAAPLSRRMVLILLKFQAATGHAHPRRDAALRNYAGILEALGRTQAEIIAERQALLAEAGLEGL